MNPRRARRRQRSREHRQRARVATAIHQAVRAILPDLPRHYPKTKVNWGWCVDVAAEAREILARRGIHVVTLQDDAQLCVQHDMMHESGWTHEWIWTGGFHYDSEAPWGLRRWQDLPHFRRWARPRIPAIRVQAALSPRDEQSMLNITARFVQLSRESLGRELAGIA